MSALRVRSLVSDGRVEVLARAARAAREAIGGDGFIAHHLAWTERRPVVTAQVAGGISRSMAGSLDLQVGREPIPFGSWSPDLPDHLEREQTVSLEVRARPLGAPDRELIAEHFRPHGLHDMARRLLYDGRRFVAVVSVERAPDRPAFDAAELARMDAALECWVGELVAQEALEVGLVGPSCALLFDARGRCLHVSPGARAWATTERVAALSDAARRVDAGGAARRLLVGGTEARLARVEAGGGTRVLVTLRPTVAPLMHPAADLSVRQREVVGYAAVGATAKEIGATLGITAHTVRRHLRVAYRVLGVRNRVELARRLDEVAGTLA
ncbi:MAG TPA: helix-turn-helix transcriptional regulator [Polyangiaceae bacterium LLY-WYZ-15_(1-7)]|nr:helix-turn-helix transcriptional regulator [Polyangiaceae bacterium LLY-WYZ-15_(1-7)]